MSQFSFLSSQIENSKKDYTRYSCPFCNASNSINSTECKHCNNSLVEYESIIFANYNLYNKSLEFARNNDYISALEDITLFLHSFPDDLEANRLKFYLLKKLNSVNFEKQAEDYISSSSDRWIAQLIDDENSLSLKDLHSKVVYNGKISAQIPNAIEELNKSKAKLSSNIIETINALYNIYIKKKYNSKKDKAASEFITFYEKIFLLFLKKQDILVVDYYNKNYKDLTEEEQKCIGWIDNIVSKKIEDGKIIQVFNPEIKNSSFIIQKARITVAQNIKKETKQK